MTREWKEGDPSQPGGAGNWDAPTPMEVFVRDELERRAEWAARPEVAEMQRLAAQSAEFRRNAKARAKGKDDGLYGPPDPRKGRVPMTR